MDPEELCADLRYVLEQGMEPLQPGLVEGMTRKIAAESEDQDERERLLAILRLMGAFDACYRAALDVLAAAQEVRGRRPSLRRPPSRAKSGPRKASPKRRGES